MRRNCAFHMMHHHAYEFSVRIPCGRKSLSTLLWWCTATSAMLLLSPQHGRAGLRLLRTARRTPAFPPSFPGQTLPVGQPRPVKASCASSRPPAARQVLPWQGPHLGFRLCLGPPGLIFSCVHLTFGAPASEAPSLTSRSPPKALCSSPGDAVLGSACCDRSCIHASFHTLAVGWPRARIMPLHLYVTHHANLEPRTQQVLNKCIAERKDRKSVV